MFILPLEIVLHVNEYLTSDNDSENWLRFCGVPMLEIYKIWQNQADRWLAHPFNKEFYRVLLEPSLESRRHENFEDDVRGYISPPQKRMIEDGDLKMIAGNVCASLESIRFYMVCFFTKTTF